MLSHIAFTLWSLLMALLGAALVLYGTTIILEEEPEFFLQKMDFDKIKDYMVDEVIPNDE